MYKKLTLTSVLLNVFMLVGCATTGQPSQGSILTPQPTLPPGPLSLYVATNYPLPQRGGYNTIYAFHASDGSKRWQHNTGMDIEAGPVLGGGVIYYVVDGVLYAITATDNKPLWHYKTRGTPMVFEGVAYVTAVDASSNHEQVVALGAATGKVLWQTDLGNQQLGLEEVADGVLYLESETGIVAFSAGNGQQLWSQKIAGTPVILQVADGQVYIDDLSDSHTDSLVVLSARDGSVRWRFSPNAGIMPVPLGVVVNGVVYTSFLSAGFSTVQALNTRDGSVRWQQSFQNAVEFWFLSQGTLYLSMDDGSVAALNPSDGSTQWHAQVGQDTFSILLFGKDGLVYSDGAKGLIAFSSSDGSVKWHFPIEEKVDLKVYGIINGVIYLGTSDEGNQTTHDTLYALNASDGSVRWKYDVGGHFDVVLG